MQLWETLGWLYEGLFSIKAHRELVEDIAQQLKPGAAILDAGCGTGMLAHYAKRKDIVCLDFSSSMLKRARKRADIVLQGDITATGLTPESFDQIVSINVLYAVPMDAAIKELAALIKPKGELIVANPTTPHLLPLLTDHFRRATWADNTRLMVNLPRLIAWMTVLTLRSRLDAPAFSFEPTEAICGIIEANGLRVTSTRRAYADIDVVIVAIKE